MTVNNPRPRIVRASDPDQHCDVCDHRFEQNEAFLLNEEGLAVCAECLTDEIMQMIEAEKNGD